MEKTKAEYEKMISGEIYDSSDEKLSSIRQKAHSLCRNYNQLSEADVKGRNKILKELIPEQKENLYIQGPVQFDYGINTSFGKNCYANFNLVILDCAKVIIGDDVFFGPNCTLATALHPLTAEERKERLKKDGSLYTLEYAEEIKIGSGTWLCSNVTVCAGVTVGKNCVIGAGSVVTRDIPDNSLAAGVPCRVIRKITEKDKMLP